MPYNYMTKFKVKHESFKALKWCMMIFTSLALRVNAALGLKSLIMADYRYLYNEYFNWFSHYFPFHFMLSFSWSDPFLDGQLFQIRNGPLPWWFFSSNTLTKLCWTPRTKFGQPCLRENANSKSWVVGHLNTLGGEHRQPSYINRHPGKLLTGWIWHHHQCWHHSAPVFIVTKCNISVNMFNKSTPNTNADSRHQSESLKKKKLNSGHSFTVSNISINKPFRTLFITFSCWFQ